MFERFTATSRETTDALTSPRATSNLPVPMVGNNAYRRRNLEEQRGILEEMQSRLRSTEGERDQLQTALKSTQQSQTQVENGLRQDAENLKRRLTQAETLNDSLKRSYEAAQLLIEETKASQKQQSHNAQKVDEERSVLESKIVDLQVELAALKKGKTQPVTDQSYEDLKSEKEALEQQVNFMNSVIVDMQHKNDDLRSRLDILETEVIFDGHLQLGIPQHRSISRLFCDICNIFDIHDTEDCPKQRNIRRTPSYSSQESEF
ncbi:CAP-Gly domain-containing linker protein 1 [Araneus ventricosus]|uniref:CAP-Gly domain-containing linker protein 1 n=1 Tax=Araneus ventricosus TaxID=182803 RepID=A0A4Y2F5Z5_ARAVE|nr:CAP-Gly domain-containing linker protein 1 [Araneus ventricosus]